MKRVSCLHCCSLFIMSMFQNAKPNILIIPIHLHLIFQNTKTTSTPPTSCPTLRVMEGRMCPFTASGPGPTSCLAYSNRTLFPGSWASRLVSGPGAIQLAIRGNRTGLYGYRVYRPILGYTGDIRFAIGGIKPYVHSHDIRNWHFIGRGSREML